MTVVAALSQRLRSFHDFDEYAAVTRARVLAAEADVRIFPEYGGLELGSLLPVETRRDLHAMLHEIEVFGADFVELYRRLSAEVGGAIVCPSLPWRDGDRFVNRAWVAIDGALDHQDKLIMTRFERERWGVQGGRTVRTFDGGGVRFGVAICYDAEFPLIGRELAERGATLIAVPSCTDRLAGYHRVRIGARARALENQCIVAQACTVGHVDDSPAIDVNIGAAAIFCPPDVGYPSDGVIVEAPLDDEERWVRASIDPAQIAETRLAGQVLLYRDFPEHLALLGLTRAGRGRS